MWTNAALVLIAVAQLSIGIGGGLVGHEERPYGRLRF